MVLERDLDHQRPQGLPETTHVRNRRCKFRPDYVTNLDVFHPGPCVVACAGYPLIIPRQESDAISLSI